MAYTINPESYIKSVQINKPIVHHITNFVTANDCANVTLALGGSPIMSTHHNEVEDVLEFADSLVLNLGTFQEDTLHAMLLAGKKANAKGIPIILDPVGISALPFRRKQALKLLKELKIQVIKGNAKEIACLSVDSIVSKGLDDVSNNIPELNTLKELSLKYDCIIAMTGATDYITDGIEVVKLTNGHPHLTKITGTGCMTSSIIACLLGTRQSGSKQFLMDCTIIGILTTSLAGLLAYNQLEHEKDYGTFKVSFIDALNKIDYSQHLSKEGMILYEQ